MGAGKTHLSVTVRTSIYRQLEEARKLDGQGRSAAVDEAIETWLRLRDERLMREACISEAEENRDMARSAKRAASKVPLG